MSDSESSALSSPPASEDEKKFAPIFLKAKANKTKVKKIVLAPPEPPSPPKPKRSPSPAHEEVLADNPDIAVSLRLRKCFPDCIAIYHVLDARHSVLTRVDCSSL